MDSSVLAIAMFVSLFALLLSGYPVAFVLGAVGLFFGVAGFALGIIEPELLNAVLDRLLGIMKNDTLLAIPFFTLMGLVLERSGMAEELLEACNRLLAKVRGGLAFAVILVGAVMASTTGIVAASIMSLGLISLPVMLRNGYSAQVSTGVIAASGTLAQIIPPSLVLIVLADVLSVSVKDMYHGALLPSLMLVVLYGLYIAFLGHSRPHLLPALQENLPPVKPKQILLAIIPPITLMALVLGSIFMAIATPTEAGAMGAFGALALSYARKRLDWPQLQSALQKTANLTSFVMFILIGSSIFALTFRALNGDLWVEHLFAHIPGGQLGFLIVVNLMVAILGMFLDFFEIVFIVVPLLVGMLHQLGIAPLWFGVMLAINLQTSFLTPPFGFSLFYLRSVAPSSVPTSAIYKGIVPFVIIQLLMVVAIISFPGLVLTEDNSVAGDEQGASITLPANMPNGDVGDQQAINLMQQLARTYANKEL